MESSGRAFVAEFVGTFALVFVGAGSIVMDAYTNGGVGLLGVALAHGLVLAIAVTATLKISGGHINPAVTFGAWLGRQIETRRALLYVLAQLLGAAVAGFLLRGLYPADAAAAAGLGTPTLAGGVSFAQGVALEAVLTFFLVFAVYGTAIDPRAPAVGGFGIGLVLTFDILAGGPLTGASMNPARTFGPALAGGVWSDHLVWWIGPLLGGAVAGLVYSRVLMPGPAAGAAAGH